MFERIVRREVSRLRSPRLRFNENKRGVFGPGQRRMVTGLVVTPEGEVSIGRERKRLLSALLHKYSIGEATAEQVGILKGMLGFSLANEPAFVERLRRKYGNDLVHRALRLHIPSKLVGGG